MIKTVLFDLDGTLLPMDQQLFVKDYLSKLCIYFKDYGYNPELFEEALIKGIKTMYANDGSKTNQEVFINVFEEYFGKRIYDDLPLFDNFYHNEFQDIKRHCEPKELVKELIKFLNDNHINIIISTNPLFPRIATNYRIQWAGIDTKDILHFTTYEDYCFTKPSLNYYKSILDRFHIDPKECLMVGNDVDEDMIVEHLGISTFLITDCLINKNNKDISIYNKGNFNDLINYIKKDIL